MQYFLYLCTQICANYVFNHTQIEDSPRDGDRSQSQLRRQHLRMVIASNKIVFIFF